MTRWLHALLIPALALALAWVPAQAQDSALPVVMVADLSGKVLRGGGQPLTLAEGIPAQRALTLAAGARLTVIHLKTGEELIFLGPGTVRFDAEGLPLGAKPTGRRKVAALGEGFRLEPGAWAQASVVMRKEISPDGPFVMETEEPLPFNPEPAEETQGVWLTPRGTATLETHPGFRWQLPLPGLTAKLRLTDSTGQSVFEEAVQGDRLRLPVDKGLHFGDAYHWRLSWTLPDGQMQYVEGGFTVLPEADARLIQGLRPAQNASFAERLTFAAALESRGLLDEAQPYWRNLASERPEDITLQRFAAP